MISGYAPGPEGFSASGRNAIPAPGLQLRQVPGRSFGTVPERGNGRGVADALKKAQQKTRACQARAV